MLQTLILIYVFGLGETYSTGYNYSLYIHFIASLILLYNWVCLWLFYIEPGMVYEDDSCSSHKLLIKTILYLILSSWSAFNFNDTIVTK